MISQQNIHSRLYKFRIVSYRTIYIIDKNEIGIMALNSQK